MEHKYTKNITCPYCDWEDQDSWEFDEDEGTYTCGNCDEEFFVERHVEVTYSTTRLSCTEKNLDHVFGKTELFISKRKYENGAWVTLEKEDWEYARILYCRNCDYKKYVPIPKKEYEKLTESRK